MVINRCQGYCTWCLAELASIFHSSHVWFPVCHRQEKQKSPTEQNKNTDHFPAITIIWRKKKKEMQHVLSEQD